jgi:hypothetical protein
VNTRAATRKRERTDAIGCERIAVAEKPLNSSRKSASMACERGTRWEQVRASRSNGATRASRRCEQLSTGSGRSGWTRGRWGVILAV